MIAFLFPTCFNDLFLYFVSRSRFAYVFKRWPHSQQLEVRISLADHDTSDSCAMLTPKTLMIFHIFCMLPVDFETLLTSRGGRRGQFFFRKVVALVPVDFPV